MIKVNIDYTKEEMERFFRFHFLVKNKLRYLYIGVSLLFGLLSFYYLFFTSEFFLGLVLILFAFIIMVLYPLTTNKAIKKRLENQRKLAQDSLVITNANLSLTSSENQKTFNWDEVLEVLETKTNFYLYISKHKALIINKDKIILGTLIEFIQILKDNNKTIILYKKL